ncbi:glutathione S-transferase family protein [Chelativorans sp.]|uniref:glutathione S-transferase family protein n=1 Tax=Chelativorans sp. TaxID=2203393 RepID=UPI002810E6E1|nr:glutathione S-transferase family protein [Chelativorans sp.]
MKLYYGETLNPRKVCAVARHLNSPVEFVHVDLSRGGHMTPEFTAMNPNRKLPVLEANGRTLWESNAIMCFLARAANSDLWPQDERQIEVLRWLNWDGQHFSHHGGTLYFQYIVKPRFGLGEPDARAVQEATTYWRSFAAVLNDHLRGREYLLGETLTVADFALGVTLPYAEPAHIPVKDFPEIERWHDRLNALPAWREPFPVMAAA